MYNKVEHIHLEPTSECNARCPMCERTYETTLETHPCLKVTEWKSNDLDKILDDPFFKDVKIIHINGNYGDIVSHSHPKELLNVIIKRNIALHINTNGGALNTEFWKWLGSYERALVEFDIDGLEVTHHLYRRNTRFDIVIKNAKAYIDAGGKAKWAMNGFKHNEHQVEECRELAKDLGFSQFYYRPSSRWMWSSKLDILDKNYNFAYSIEPAKEFQDLASKLPYYKSRPPEAYKNKIYNKRVPLVETNCNVNCKVIGEKSIYKLESVYISSDQRLWPCCWMHLDDIRSDWKENKGGFESLFRDKDRDFNNLLKNSVSKMLENGLFKRISDSWNTNNVLYECARTCKDKNNFQMQTSVSSHNDLKK